MAEEFRSPYASYDVLAKWDSPSWDDATREVVRKRLEDVPRREYLDAEEWRTLEAVSACLIPQPDRGDRPIPIVPFIDEKLKQNAGVGYRYEDMPPLRAAWRWGIAGIEGEARHRFHRGFADLAREQQEEVLRAVQTGQVRADLWKDLPPKRFFSQMLLKTVVGIYYAHPAAWSEVGFGGPASPRGYVRREIGKRDRWEAGEAWSPVADEEGKG